MSPDVVIQHALAAAFAAMFTVGALQKLSDREAFAAAVDNYEIVPGALIGVFAWLLPLTELTAAIALLLPSTRPLGAALALVLLFMVTLAIVINLVRGRTDVGCGCGGLEDEQLLSWPLVARNLILCVATLPLLTETSGRGLHALDYLTIAGGSLTLFGLYATASQLIANRPRLARIRPAR